ncbi:MAG: hypothetical protein ACRDJ3_08285, partial [Solirubrobacteraceae bacterium]
MIRRLTPALCGLCLAVIPAVARAESFLAPAPLPTPSPAPSPLDPGPPVAITGTSTVEAQTISVALTGGVAPHNLTTDFRIEYGTTTAYELSNSGNHPATVMIPSSITEPVGTVLNLLTLQYSTTYHYRVTAENSMGVSHGEDATFSTPPVVSRPRPPHHPTPWPPTSAVSQAPVKRALLGSSCAHPFKQIVLRNGDNSTGDHRHINVLVSPPVGMEWNPIGKVEICSASGVDTSGKHWRVTGHPRGARHYFAKG